MTLLVDMAAAARVTRLVTTDTFPPVKHLRDWLLDKVDPRQVRKVEKAEPPTFVELIECNWCAGFWISVAVVVARKRFPDLWDPIARVFATSYAVGMLAGLSEREGDLEGLGKKLDGIGLWIGNKLQAIADSNTSIELTGVLETVDPDPHLVDGQIMANGLVVRTGPFLECDQVGPHYHPHPIDGSPTLVEHDRSRLKQKVKES